MWYTRALTYIETDKQVHKQVPSAHQHIIIKINYSKNDFHVVEIEWASVWLGEWVVCLDLAVLTPVIDDEGPTR